MDPHVILIGGPPRVGKTTAAALIGRALRCGWTSLDVIRGIVGSLVPDIAAAVGVGMPPAREAELFFPHFEQAAGGVFYLHGTHVLGGVGFMPADVPRLGAWISRSAIFLGARTFDLELAREHAGRNRWIDDVTDDERALVPAWIESWSRDVEAQCADADIPYVDIGAGFDDAMRRVVDLAVTADPGAR